MKTDRKKVRCDWIRFRIYVICLLSFLIIIPAITAMPSYADTDWGETLNTEGVYGTDLQGPHANTYIR